MIITFFGMMMIRKSGKNCNNCVFDTSLSGKDHFFEYLAEGRTRSG